MRLTFELLGWTLDWSLTPTASDESEFEEYQDAGSIGSERLDAGPVPFGEAQISNHFYEPAEGDEDRKRLGFGR